MKSVILWISVIFLCASVELAASDANFPIFHIPQLEGISIDGNPVDWGNAGFRVNIISSEAGTVLPAHDLDARFRLGWDTQGILLLLTVKDDAAVESPDEERLWQSDSVQLFVATEPDSSEYYQVIFSPGLDPEFPELRQQIIDLRKNPPADEELTANVARTVTEAGYMLEALLPWENLGIEPKIGQEIGFQLYVSDFDDPEDSFEVIWYPRSGTHLDSSAMHRLRLAVDPSPPILASARGEYEHMRRIRVDVLAAEELMGKEVEIKHNQVSMVSGELTSDQGRASVNLTIPMPPRGEPYGELAVIIDTEHATSLMLPDADEKRAKALIDAEIHFHPPVFSGTQFPSCDFECPYWAEELIGPYSIETTFYDSNYNQVTSAEEPGRYGAVVEVIPEQGRIIRRFRTLFRYPEDIPLSSLISWFLRNATAFIDLPQEVDIDPDVITEQSRAISEYLKWQFVNGDGFYSKDETAALLAGLYETEAGSGETGVAEDVWARDRQWWVVLKRKIYRTGEIYPEPFECPLLVDGDPAPMLRQGTPVEAGMKPDTVDRIDSVCRAWAASADEPFAICVARQGVIVIHKAYGQRDGRPMTVNDKGWMASITKLMSGTLMMMLVDQGLVDLGDRVDKFIPALGNIDVETPLTIRHLYTHTNGLWGSWGDDLNDFEEIIANYYPYLEIGVRFSYNGNGYALGGKVIEAVTGEAIPQFFKHHLLDPLGCTNTRVAGTCGDSFSIPLDIAKIGQMLLNKGRYGNMQFFSEETAQKMLPVKLSKLLGPETDIERGIGVVWYRNSELGEGTFGHGAASSATLRIDPVNDLVIVMTRNTAGGNFRKYHPKFISAIVESLAE